MRKHSLLAVMLVGLMSMMTLGAIAQSDDQQSAPAGEQQGHGGRHFDPEKRLQMLTQQLKLTSDQQPKVLDVLKAEQSQMESLRSDSSLSQDDRRSKMMEIHKASNDQIRALLDPKQQKKWDAMQSQHQQWQGHHQDDQGGGAANDSQQK
jgi:periplasmic protein CpxP/Spy